MHIKLSQDRGTEAVTLDIGKTKTLIETDRSNFEQATLNDEDYKL